jgi:LysR family transcriptional regulator, benzoate and cis,cis-muconate-responsive activator of ben and cat genes
MEIELRHMRAFVALAEERHFGRAAAQLGIAQPPLSRQIQDLERELGAELVDRGTRPPALTAAGEAFLEQARLALDQARRAVDRGRRAGRGQLAWLRVGALTWAFNGIVPEVAQAFRARHPDVRLALSTTGHALQADSLRDETLDVVFAQSIVDSRGLQVEPLLEEALVALVPERHRFASRSTLSLEELVSEPFVAMCSVCTPDVAKEQATLFRSLRLTREIAEEACGPLQQLGLVAAGFGLALSPASMGLVRREGVAFVPLERGTPTLPLHLLWRRGDEREPLRLFLDTARELAHSTMPIPH